MKNLLSIQNAANLLGVHPETLRRWDNDGKLKAVKVGDRGDRWYKQEDLLKIKFGTLPEKYKDYTIMPYSQGFEISPGTLIRIASFIVSKDNLISVFAFNDGGILLHMTHPYLKDEDMLEEAIKIIKGYIDLDKIQHLEEYTFSYYPTNYLEDKNPKWWIKSLKRIYGEPTEEVFLIPELKAVINNVHPAGQGSDSWRVIVKFETFYQEKWTVAPFGSKNEFTEYYVTVSKEYFDDHTELRANGDGAKKFALEYIQARFEETKDENGDRDITKIAENSVITQKGGLTRGVRK